CVDLQTHMEHGWIPFEIIKECAPMSMFSNTSILSMEHIFFVWDSVEREYNMPTNKQSRGRFTLVLQAHHCPSALDNTNQLFLYFKSTVHEEHVLRYIDSRFDIVTHN